MRPDSRICLLFAWFLGCSPAVGWAAIAEASKLVVVFYPEANDGSPGVILADRGIRSTFATGSSERIDVHNEYLDVTRFADDNYQQELAKFLRRKYAGRKVDLIIAALSSALDFSTKYRAEIFPNVPLVICAIDRKEVEARELAADIVGSPMTMDLAASLELALRLHPATERVFVVVGKSKFDSYWEAEARQRFRDYARKVEVNYLSGLPMPLLVERVENLPRHSLIYYLHVFEDGDGKIHMPADVVELLAAQANAPIFSHVDSYIGRGIVGGRVFRFEAEGQRAAQFGLRLLSGERPEQIGIQRPGENSNVFDWRQLKRWGISEASLPADSVVRYKVPTVWDLYKWHITALISACIFQGLLITGLIVQGYRRQRAEQELRVSQAVLQELTGKLFGAQEAERRRIARELHDDFGQTLALLSVEMDLLRQRPPETSAQLGPKIETMSARVKQLSSSIHDLSHQLHPMKLEQLGLVASLRGLCKEVAQSHGLDVNFVHDQAPEAIPHDAGLCLYRIAQEALRNVIKHSRARQALVELSGLPGAIRLCIEDDGSGFDSNSDLSQGGLGLASMRERLRLVNGELSIDSRPPKGTRIEARVPLCAARSAKVELEAASANS